MCKCAVQKCAGTSVSQLKESLGEFSVTIQLLLCAESIGATVFLRWPEVVTGVQIPASYGTEFEQQVLIRREVPASFPISQL